MDWAEKAAQKDIAIRDADKNQTERGNREARLKAHSGPGLFSDLAHYIHSQVSKYNQQIGEEVFVMSESIQPPADLQNNRTIIVKRKDGTKGPPVWTIFILGGPSFRGFCERACPERSRRGGHSRTSFRVPSFSQ